MELLCFGSGWWDGFFVCLFSFCNVRNMWLKTQLLAASLLRYENEWASLSFKVFDFFVSLFMWFSPLLTNLKSLHDMLLICQCISNLFQIIHFWIFFNYYSSTTYRLLEVKIIEVLFNVAFKHCLFCILATIQLQLIWISILFLNKYFTSFSWCTFTSV